MEFLVSLIRDAAPYFDWPGAAGLAVWIGSAGLLIYLLWRSRGYQRNWDRADWVMLGVFLLASLAAPVVVGVRAALPEPLVIPGQFGRTNAVIWAVLASVPWLLAAGLAGPVASLLLAFVVGTLTGLFHTHNPFTALVYAGLGLLAGVCFQQNYRTPVFKLLRHPLVCAVVLAALYPFLFGLGVLPWAEDSLAAELDYVFRLWQPESIAFAASLAVAAVAAVAVRAFVPQRWGQRGPLLPSPAERSLGVRSFLLMGIILVVFLGALSGLGWAIASRAAYDLVAGRMQAAARIAADGIPGAIGVGQNLIQAAAADADLAAGPESAAAALRRLQLVSPYFSELLLVDAEFELTAAVGRSGEAPPPLSQVEEAGVRLALAGVPFQYYPSVPGGGGEMGVSFLTPLPDGGQVLVGRTGLSENPFTAPILASLSGLDDISGQGLLLDENGTILYHPVPEMIGASYAGASELAPDLAEGVNAEGRRVLLFMQPATGGSWMLLVEVPKQEVQQRALDLAAPLVGLLAALGLASLLLLWVTLRFVTGSLRQLSNDALRIAKNQTLLAEPLAPGGVDEVGSLRQAFERMRVSLKTRLDEQQQLLLASHGAASSLDFSLAVQPILDAALTTGAVSARVALTEPLQPDPEGKALRAFGSGASAAEFAYLDGQILRLCRDRSPLVLSNPVGHPELTFQEGRAIPRGLVGVALRQEKDILGVLWAAYREPRQFEEEEIRFLSTLSGQAALAAANARLFTGAETGRERLAAILASTPDPVIVTDQQHALLLANRAAWQVLGPALETGQGLAIADLITEPTLLALLLSDQEEPQAIEVTAPDQRVYVAKASSVLAGGRRVGRICVLRDVTRFKELDALKSDFVSTISHDLGSPLALIRGYAAMIALVGDLTGEQESFVTKIISGVDRMAAMVSNLVQLGRIEAGVGLYLELFSPLELAEQVVEHLRPLAAGKNLTLTLHRPADGVESIEADRSFLERALVNLVENAIKYTPDGGRVSVAVVRSENPPGVRFSVADTGIGIALADQDRLFERFYRVPSREARQQSGSGLGLTIVRSIAERHHGRVWVESEAGKGSTFHLAVPERQPQK